VSGLSDVAAIATGSGHDCALLTDGTVECWGDNSSGELGAGTMTGPQTCFDGSPCSATPVAVSGLSGVTALAAGGSQTCALLAGGTVECWGDNAYGELGEGTSTGPQRCVEEFACSTAPVAVPGLSGVTALAAGAEHTCALLSAGTVVCWGDNTFGELGDGSILGPEQCRGGDPTGEIGAGYCSTTPVAVSGLSGVVALAAAGWETCALLSGGTVVCWGYDEYGWLTGATSADLGICGGGDQCAMTPIAVPGLSGVTAVAASGEWQTCALLSGETVECWGDNAYGELGDGTSTGNTMCEGYPCSAPPAAVPGLRDVTAIAVGEGHGCALLSSGAVECWGENEHGELGTGTSTGPETCNGQACSTTPVAVSGL
jgi:alpha-tubulin suppressor-like RCC1 family protein